MPEVMSKKVVAIDYPRANETIKSDKYTFRVEAMEGATNVEVSIDDAAFEPCRRDGNSWWYDWSCYGSGDHEMTARVHLANGHHHATEHRDFTVELENADCSANGSERRTIATRRAQQHPDRPDAHKYMINKYVVAVPNKPEIMRQLTELLSQEGVNVHSMLMQNVGEVATFKFLVEKEKGLRQTLESQGFHVVEDKVFCLDLPNRPGELDQLAQKLMNQGVAIRYLYGTSHGHTTKVVLSVDRPENAVGVVRELGKQFAEA